ncbi:MAG: hypothetical protein AB1665_07835 [Candidatus Thermoplasmatota archaeon]
MYAREGLNPFTCDELFNPEILHIPRAHDSPSLVPYFSRVKALHQAHFYNTGDLYLPVIRRWTMDEHQRKLAMWFRSLSPERRLAIVVEIENFRKGARFVRDNEDISSPEQG